MRIQVSLNNSLSLTYIVFLKFGEFGLVAFDPCVVLLSVFDGKVFHLQLHLLKLKSRHIEQFYKAILKRSKVKIHLSNTVYREIFTPISSLAHLLLLSADKFKTGPIQYNFWIALLLRKCIYHKIVSWQIQVREKPLGSVHRRVGKKEKKRGTIILYSVLWDFCCFNYVLNCNIIATPLPQSLLKKVKIKFLLY